MMIQHVACNLCGCSDSQVLYAGSPRIYTPGTQVVQCRQCSLVYLNPRLAKLADNFTMQEAYLHDFYLPFYQREGLLSETNTARVETILAYYQHYLQTLQPYRQVNRVLDVGCAIGLFLLATRADGWESYGIDPSGPLSAYGRNQYGLPIYQNELHETKLPPRHFDVVTLWNVVEHLFDPQAVLREVFRVLRPGGLLIVQMPNWNSRARSCLGPDWDMFVTDHFYYFTVTTTHKLLTQTGYELKHINAAELCAAEISEIRQKVDEEAAEQAFQQWQHSPEQDCGSMITAYAQKPLTMPDRLRKTNQLLRAGKLRILTQEIYNYLRWQMTTRR